MLFIDGFYLKIENGDYQTGEAIINLSSFLEYSLLFELRSDQMAELTVISGACQLSRLESKHIYK